MSALGRLNNNGVNTMSRMPMPAPDEPITSSRPYAPPETVKNMMNTSEPRPSARFTARTSMTGTLPPGSVTVDATTAPSAA